MLLTMTVDGRCAPPVPFLRVTGAHKPNHSSIRGVQAHAAVQLQPTSYSNQLGLAADTRGQS
jgi:hypothetical protein